MLYASTVKGGRVTEVSGRNPFPSSKRHLQAAHILVYHRSHHIMGHTYF
jgi:hypothetical protein